jgi:hypothetical protein
LDRKASRLPEQRCLSNSGLAAQHRRGTALLNPVNQLAEVSNLKFPAQ